VKKGQKMSESKRKVFTGAQKAKVALAAVNPYLTKRPQI
jgi:hypothetical protein